MTAPVEGGSRGLLFILGATAIAGISGYAIQLLAAGLLPDAHAYLSFSAFWSTIYLCGAAVGGVQQEIARAAHSAPLEADRGRTLTSFSLGAVVTVIPLAVIVGVLVGPVAFGEEHVTLSMALAVGLVGYVLTSIATGLFYGVRRLGAVAWLIIVDAVLRGAAVVIGLAVGAPPGVLAFAIALPFGLAVGAVWMVMRRGIAGRYELDVPVGRLTRNSLQTVLAAAATGLMVTGMPLLFRVALTDSTAVALASLTLVVTLTRAPLIIPLMALQSYLVVSFRDDEEHAAARVRRLLAAVVAVTSIAAGLGWFVGPWAVDLVSHGQYSVDGLSSALVIVSAGLVACLCVTGPALLADGRHGLYSAGWAVAAVATVGLLFLAPGSPDVRAFVGLIAAPALGIVVHVLGLVRPPRRAPVD